MWVKLCEKIGTHPKLLAVGAEAAWLWVTSIAYANVHATNGLLPKRALRAFFPTDDWTAAKVRGLAERLVAVGLWEENSEDSWQIHDYSVYQAVAMRDRIEAKRESDRVRQADYRAAKAAKSNSRVIKDLGDLSQSDGVRHQRDSHSDTSHDLSRRGHGVSQCSDPIRSGSEGHSRERARAREGAGVRETPRATRSPRSALEAPPPTDAQPTRPEALDAPVARQEEPVSAPPIADPLPGASPPLPVATPRATAHELRDPSLDAFAAYVAAEWPDKADTLTSPALLAEYVADNWRKHSEGVFQSSASPSLLMGLGRAILAEKLTREETRSIAMLLRKRAKEVFVWDSRIGGGRAVTLSFLLGRALGDATYEARPFSELVAFARKLDAERAARARTAAAKPQESARELPFVPAPKAVPATPPAAPATPEEIAAQMVSIRASLQRRKEERLAEDQAIEAAREARMAQFNKPITPEERAAADRQMDPTPWLSKRAVG